MLNHHSSSSKYVHATNRFCREQHEASEARTHDSPYIRVLLAPPIPIPWDRSPHKVQWYLQNSSNASGLFSQPEDQFAPIQYELYLIRSRHAVSPSRHPTLKNYSSRCSRLSTSCLDSNDRSCSGGAFELLFFFVSDLAARFALSPLAPKATLALNANRST